ncbi:MAG: cytochrome P450 [Pseudomonadota bacterium]
MHPLGNIDLHSIERYHAHGYPWEDWARLRREAPVYWYERDGIEPFWAITRYADVKRVSLDDKTFINGGPRLRLAPDDYEQRRLRANAKKIRARGWDPAVPEDLVYLDNPTHRALRRIVARHFTSAYCRSISARLTAHAQTIVADFADALADGEPVDLVEGLAVKLPLATICEMMGVPVEDWKDIHRWTDALVDIDNMRWRAPGESRRDMRKRLHAEFYTYLCDLIEHKRAYPGNDLSTLLVQAEVDGAALTEQQLHGYLKLLIAAGNETTRNAATRGVLALLENPAEIARFEAAPNALNVSLVEEIVRYTSPVIQFARTVVGDVELGGQRLRTGDTVGIWYPSANRDEAVFDRPDELDITRDPNPHLGYGRGVHFCLGANLARFELRALFQAVGERQLLSRLAVAGPRRWLTDLHIGTIAEVPVQLKPG